MKAFQRSILQAERGLGCYKCVPACSDHHRGMPCFVYHIARSLVSSRRTISMRNLKSSFIRYEQSQLMKIDASHLRSLWNITCMCSFVYHFVKIADFVWNMIRKIRSEDCLDWQALSYWRYMQTLEKHRWGMICMRRLMYHKAKVKNLKWTVLCNVTFEVEINLVEWVSRIADTSKDFKAWASLACVRGITTSNSRTLRRKPCATFLVEILHAEKA